MLVYCVIMQAGLSNCSCDINLRLTALVLFRQKIGTNKRNRKDRLLKFDMYLYNIRPLGPPGNVIYLLAATAISHSFTAHDNNN